MPKEAKVVRRATCVRTTGPIKQDFAAKIGAVGKQTRLRSTGDTSWHILCLFHQSRSDGAGCCFRSRIARFPTHGHRVRGKIKAALGDDHMGNKFYASR